MTREIFVFQLGSFHLFCSLICLLQRLSDVFLSKYLSTFSPSYPFLSKDKYISIFCLFILEFQVLCPKLFLTVSYFLILKSWSVRPTILWRDRQKGILYLVLSAGHIHDKINFCLLAEEFPFILLANCPLQRLSDVFFSKYLSTFSPNYPFLSKDLLLQ